MLTIIERTTIFCFAASYALALGLDLWALVRPRPILRYAGAVAGAAGVVAHIFYLAVQPLPLASSAGSLLFLALILAIFYVYGSLHHSRLAWGLFVLPLVLALIGLAVIFRQPAATGEIETTWNRAWGYTHFICLLLAGVGVCVGFVASLMYLVQTYRLRAKVVLSQGVRMLSLERLETMNRRAVLWAFPLLTAGLLVGIGLQVQKTGTIFAGWDSPQIVSTLLVWLVFVILLYLRYWAHVRGRQVAWLTMIAFVLLIVALASPVHPFVQGGMP